MITTGANPQAAMFMSNLKNNFGKSITNGLGSIVSQLPMPSGKRMEQAVRQGYYSSIRSMVNQQAHQGQK